MYVCLFMYIYYMETSQQQEPCWVNIKIGMESQVVRFDKVLVKVN